VNDILALFDAADDEQLLGNFLGAEAEALWSLGEQAAAEERYEALIARLPNFAWGEIAVADCNWRGPDPAPAPRIMWCWSRTTCVTGVHCGRLRR